MNYAFIIPGNEQKFLHRNIISAQLLSKVNGIPIIDSLLNTCLNNNASSISCIINNSNYNLYEYLKNVKIKIPFHLIANDAEDILDYMSLVRSNLEGSPFVMIKPGYFDFANELGRMLDFVKSNNRNDSVIAIKDYEKEKEPYFVRTDGKNNVTLVSRSNIYSGLITGGIYYFDTDIFPVMEYLLKKNIKKFENLLNYLIASKFRIAAYKFSNLINIDSLLN